MEPFGISIAAWIAVGAWLYHCFLHPIPPHQQPEDKTMPRFDCELSVSLCREVEAETEEEAKEKMRGYLADGAYDDEDFTVYGKKDDGDEDEDEDDEAGDEE